MCVLHSYLKFKGLCAVVCISVALMFLVVKSFNSTKEAANEGSDGAKIRVKALSFERGVFFCVIL